MQIEVKNLTKQFKTKGKRTNLLFHEKENFTAVDNISFNINKGDIVGIKGRLQTNVLEKEDGKKENKLEIICEKITFLSSKPKEEE